MSLDGQGTKWRRNISENFNWLSMAHERYRQTTDGRATACITKIHYPKGYAQSKCVSYIVTMRAGDG